MRPDDRRAIATGWGEVGKGGCQGHPRHPLNQSQAHDHENFSITYTSPTTRGTSHELAAEPSSMGASPP
jgi:hypothetical protein